MLTLNKRLVSARWVYGGGAGAGAAVEDGCVTHACLIHLFALSLFSCAPFARQKGGRRADINNIERSRWSFARAVDRPSDIEWRGLTTSRSRISSSRSSRRAIPNAMSNHLRRHSCSSPFWMTPCLSGVVNFPASCPAQAFRRRLQLETPYTDSTFSLAMFTWSQLQVYVYITRDTILLPAQCLRELHLARPPLAQVSLPIHLTPIMSHKGEYSALPLVQSTVSDTGPHKKDSYRAGLAVVKALLFGIGLFVCLKAVGRAPSYPRWATDRLSLGLVSAEHAWKAEEQCVQATAIVPMKHAELWSSLGDTYGTDAFKSRAAEWLGGAVRVE